MKGLDVIMYILIGLMLIVIVPAAIEFLFSGFLTMVDIFTDSNYAWEYAFE